MDTNDKPENASGTQDLASTTANIASNTPANTPPPPTPPTPPAPKEASNETSLAKEFTNGVIKVLSNPPVSRDGSFEDDVDRACR